MARQRQAMIIYLTVVCGIFAGVLVPSANGQPQKESPSGGLKLLEYFLTGPMAEVDEIIFACRQLNYDGHWYANFGYYADSAERKAYRAMGRLCKLNIRTGQLTVLLDDPQGTVRDPQVHYDGRKIIFSYRKGGSENFHLYEISVDGSDLKQLTDGQYNDIEPTYLPDDTIVFCSNRCNRWVNCWLTQVAVLYRCDANGNNIRPISSNSEHENTPWPLPDGRVLYQRWEYVDRSQVHYHHLWTTNPDGTGQMIYYGNMHPGTVMIDAKPIPGTEKVVAVFSPGHGRKEHDGQITIVTPKAGPDEIASAQPVSKTNNYRDPYPFSEDCFLVAQGTRLLLMNGQGQTHEIYRLPAELVKAGVQCHEPRPLLLRPRERVIPSRVDQQQSTGRLVLTDVYNGRKMQSVKRGEIKKLLVLETLPMPIHYTGGMEPLSYGGTFTLERILGTVPVEPDGSAYMELPALRSLFFVALDENNNSVKRMQSFLTVMPGETTSCVGCHERRTQTPVTKGQSALQALSRPPDKITPIAGIPDIFDFPRDIQPLLDKYCLSCHGYEAISQDGPRAGGVILSGDRGPFYSHSYYTLTMRRQFVDGRNQPKSNLAPRSIGSSVSPLMKKFDGNHYSVKATRQELDMIRYWIESGAPYPGTYAALGCGMIGGYAENKQDQSDHQWPSTIAAAEAIRQRCVQCHDKSLPLPLALSDNRNIPPWDARPGYVPRHLVFNLTRPEKSLILLAPLSKQAGGYGLCEHRDKDAKPDEPVTVFADTNDPDYQKILALCAAGKKHLDEIKRFDMPDFRPRPAYVREMKRYGILPKDIVVDAAIDVYATDRAYWRSLWYKPPSSGNHD
ncbi:MAG: PD40 domain-containing protein [Planctomycetes bacterium]|nr:PD40 domain-containing protein [Planctomycetota bacterium]